MAHLFIFDFTPSLRTLSKQKSGRCFCHLELIEAFGSGIPKMTQAYENKDTRIEFRTSSSGFMVLLPNLNDRKEKMFSSMMIKDHAVFQNTLLDQRTEAAAKLIEKKGSVSRQELEVVWEVGRSAAGQWLNQLIGSGFLIRSGQGKNTRYIKRQL